MSAGKERGMFAYVRYLDNKSCHIISTEDAYAFSPENRHDFNDKKPYLFKYFLTSKVNRQKDVEYDEDGWDFHYYKVQIWRLGSKSELEDATKEGSNVKVRFSPLKDSLTPDEEKVFHHGASATKSAPELGKMMPLEVTSTSKDSATKSSKSKNMLSEVLAAKSREQQQSQHSIPQKGNSEKDASNLRDSLFRKKEEIVHLKRELSKRGSEVESLKAEIQHLKTTENDEENGTLLLKARIKELLDKNKVLTSEKESLTLNLQETRDTVTSLNYLANYQEQELKLLRNRSSDMLPKRVPVKRQLIEDSLGKKSNEPPYKKLNTAFDLDSICSDETYHGDGKAATSQSSTNSAHPKSPVEEFSHESRSPLQREPSPWREPSPQLSSRQNMAGPSKAEDAADYSLKIENGKPKSAKALKKEVETKPYLLTGPKLETRNGSKIHIGNDFWIENTDWMAIRGEQCDKSFASKLLSKLYSPDELKLRSWSGMSSPRNRDTDTAVETKAISPLKKKTLLNAMEFRMKAQKIPGHKIMELSRAACVNGTSGKASNKRRKPKQVAVTPKEAATDGEEEDEEKDV